MRSKFIEILKLIGFIILIPVIISTTLGFKEQTLSFHAREGHFFLWGIVTYLVMHLAVGEAKGLYDYGQKLTSSIFFFLKSLAHIVPFVVPIYSWLILILFYLGSVFFHIRRYDFLALFLFSFMFTLHLALTAKTLREQDTTILKAGYYFSLALIYIVNVFLVAALFHFVRSDFSFADFLRTTKDIAGWIYSSMFKRLFFT